MGNHMALNSLSGTDSLRMVTAGSLTVHLIVSAHRVPKSEVWKKERRRAVTVRLLQLPPAPL